MFYRLYYFPEAAVTNSQTLRNLKQQKCILSSFWRPEVWNRYQWVEIKVCVGLAGSGGFGENVFLVSSDFWWQLAFLDFYYSSLCLWGTLSSPFLCVWPLAVFSSRDICDCIRSPTLIIQDSLPTSKSLTEVTSIKNPFPYNISKSQRSESDIFGWLFFNPRHHLITAFLMAVGEQGRWVTVVSSLASLSS